MCVRACVCARVFGSALPPSTPPHTTTTTATDNLLDDSTAKALHKSLFIQPLIKSTDGPEATDSLTQRLTALCTHPNAPLRAACLSALYRHMAQRAFFIAECKRITILVQPEAVLVYHSTRAANIELAAMAYGLSQSEPELIKRAVHILNRLVSLLLPAAEKGRRAGFSGGHKGVLPRRGSVMAEVEVVSCWG